MLSVGAQDAYWRGYARWARLSHCLKWHEAMPAITAATFPGGGSGVHLIIVIQNPNDRPLAELLDLLQSEAMAALVLLGGRFSRPGTKDGAKGEYWVLSGNLR